MKIAKLEAFNYEIEDFYEDNRLIHTVVYIHFESIADPYIYDVINEVKSCTEVHIDGRRFANLHMVLNNPDPVKGGIVLRMTLLELFDESRGII